MKTDIKDFADIKLMVDSFYEQVRKDALIGPIFNEVINNLHFGVIMKFHSITQW